MLIRNYFQILLTSSLWGSSFLLMKLALDELNPFHISFYRIFIGMIFKNLFITKIDKLNKKDHLNIALVGLLWMSLPFYLFAASEETISSSLAGLINATTPVFISIIGVLFFSQKIKNKQKFYLTLGFIGIYLLTFGFNKLNVDLEIGTFLALIASISYGFAANIIQPLIEKLNVQALIRIKANLTFIDNKRKNVFHTDNLDDRGNTTALFYITSGGGTKFEKDDKFVEAKPNRMVIFMNKEKHKVVKHQTDEPFRAIINFNYF